MSITTLSKVLLDATCNNSAVGMFNPINIESLEGIIRASEELNQPIILALPEIDWDYVNIKLLMKAMVYRAENATSPIVLHLDHGQNIELMKELLDNGFTSIMIDASSLPFSQNVDITCKVVELARSYNACVEAELGHVGGSEGQDDNTDLTTTYTDIADAIKFVSQTNIDALAIAIGSSHGVYTGIPKIDLNLLQKLNSKIDIPLVLHGASGLSDQVIRECISNGIRKVNIFTDLMLAPEKPLLNHIKLTGLLNYKDVCRISIDAIKEKTLEKILLFQNK